MAGLTFLQEAARFALPFIPMLFEASLRVTIFLGVAFCALWIMKNASPGRRHVLWLAAICGSLFLFLLTVTGPVFRVAFRHSATEAPGALPALSSVLLPATGTLKTAGGMVPLAAQAWRRITLVPGWLSFWPSGNSAGLDRRRSLGMVSVALGKAPAAELDTGNPKRRRSARCSNPGGDDWDPSRSTRGDK